MSNTTKTIPIFFSIDDHYAPYLSVALISLIKNSSPQNNYQVVILYQKLSQANQAQLGKLATDNVKIQFVSMDTSFHTKLDKAQTKLRGDYVTLTIYFRLFIADLFPQYQRAIYLDADTVINTDIANLYTTDLDGKLIAAVADTFAADNQETVQYVENGLGLPIEDYFNSGVMVMDLAQLRQINFGEKFLQLLNKYNYNVMAPDQDYLNIMCHHQIKYLAATWNAQSTTGASVKQPKIVHYSLFHKPWHYNQVDNAEYFWKYAADSVYLAAIKAEKQGYSDDERQADADNQAGLLARGQLIAAQGKTLATIQASQKG